MTLTTYPSNVDYSLALQNPGAAFTDTALRTATFAGDMMGPYCITGSSAVVFHATIAGAEYALRCYTRQDASTPERYAALDRSVSDNGLSRYVGVVTWYRDEVRVKGGRWPVLKMGWIEGRQLNEYAGYLAENRNKTALGTLAQRWLTLVTELQQVSFAHGDLQHGNILVDQHGELRLVDFDSVWIPALQGQKAPTETGHPSYQPRGAAAPSRWGPYMDTFSGLVIYLALTALARDPGLWPTFNNGDNLLFERDDFNPALDRDIWKHLARLADPAVDRIAGKLRECCDPGWVASKTLQQTLMANWWEQPAGPAPAPAGGAGAAAPAKIPRQAGPAGGSLPPPPAAPYQSKVAPQPAGAPAGSSWWEQEHGEPPAPADGNAVPAVTGSGGGRNALGGLFMIAGIIVFLVLAAHHDAGAGAVTGALLFLSGIGVAASSGTPKKPPGGPPAAGGGGGGTPGGGP